MKTVLLFLLALPLLAQNPSNQDLDVLGHFNMAAGTYSAPFIPVGSDPTGACTTAGAVVMNTTTGQLTGCIALIWTPLGGAGSGNVSGPGSSTNFALAAWNGTTGLVLRNTSVITDGSGNLTATSLTTSGGGAGTIELTQGTAQGSFPANSVSLYAPATISSAYQWKLPAADAAGALVSDGVGTPGTLSIVGFTGSGSIVRATSPTISNPTITGSCTGCLSTITLSGDATGSGTTAITVTNPKINGTSVPVNSAADQFLGTTASATGAWASVPSCTDSGGNHLNYNTSTHVFSCGTSGGTAGSVAFSGITSGTNTTATMTVGTGGSLTFSGSGTVNANLISGSSPAASATTDTTNASNISSGTLGAARLPNPSATTLGGIESIAAVSHDFLTAISTSGVPAQAQPAFSDLSGSATAAQLPNPTASTLGGIESLAAVSHNWINTISTSGVPSATRPACDDLSDSAASCATDATNASNISSGTLNAARFVVPHAIGFVFPKSAAAGETYYYSVPFACTISAWDMTVDTGTATVDIWKIATGTAIPTVTNTITASALPAISTGTAKHSTTLTAWTTSVTADDIFGFNLNAVSSATKVSIVLQCQ